MTILRHCASGHIWCGWEHGFRQGSAI